MGCCQTNVEVGEIEYCNEEGTAQELNNLKTDEDFSEVSLGSHRNSPNQTVKSKLGDSIVYNTRSTSVSLHRTEFENAFLQSSAYGRRKTLEFSRNEQMEYIQDLLAIHNNFS